jgi:choline dehydrogenase-like flavoprotein
MPQRGFLNERERAVLRAVCDTFLPSLDQPPGTTDPAAIAYWRRAAADLDIAGAVEETLWLETPPEQQKQIRLALRVLASPPALRLLTGDPTPFAARSLLGREVILRGWAGSPLPPLRQAYLAFKRLACAQFYAVPGADGTNPNAAWLGYPAGDSLPTAAAPTIRPLVVDEDTVLEADVCVIGSGAGGSVAAALLAAAGRRVVVLEAGGAAQEPDFGPQEERGWERLYMRRGVLATADAGMVVLAGRTLGGGTTINWTTCFRPPPDVLAEWAAQSVVPDFLGPELQASYAAVEQRMHIHVDDGPLNPNNAVILAGTQALGIHGERNPRNVQDCGACDICHFGCRRGTKQGMLRTYLHDAAAGGAVIVANCQADRVLLADGRVTGVIARVTVPVEQRNPRAPAHRLLVRAPSVVVAGGAVQSPAILLRSGLRHPQLGRNLFLHPATAVIGEWDERIEPWRGPHQAVYSDAFADLSGDGYGLRLEAVPIFPGFAGATLPWEGAVPFRARMARLPHYNALLVLTRDRTGGRVTLDSTGAPQMAYQPGAESRRFLLRGCREGARLLLAAGARQVLTLHRRPVRAATPAALPRFNADVTAAGAAPHQMLVGSAHQMGTCRLAADPAQGVVDATGAVHGVQGLYVCDTSVFPTPSGVNPMLTVLGLAHWLTTRRLARE